KKGDLLFFLTDKSRNIPVTHVGIYIGDGNFIHAASKRKGIIITSLDDSKYSLLFVKATRIIK
ncbi:MAG: NLP/P60 family protein, partial [uncultured Sulfurovum sp.]